MAIPRPHLKNTHAGRQFWDPMHQSMFEVIFEGIAGMGLVGVTSGSEGSDTMLLSEQVTTVSGLDSLIKVVGVGEQKFMGVTNSYANPVHDTTAADITIEFNLNLKQTNDAYVYKVFSAWAKRLYDIQSGERHLMYQYTCPWLTINEANRDGSIWRTITLKKVILTGMTGLDGLDYTNNEARKLTCTFRADDWDDSSKTVKSEIIDGVITRTVTTNDLIYKEDTL
jgi:hypothetical protein